MLPSEYLPTYLPTQLRNAPSLGLLSQTDTWR